MTCFEYFKFQYLLVGLLILLKIISQQICAIPSGDQHLSFISAHAQIQQQYFLQSKNGKGSINFDIEGPTDPNGSNLDILPTHFEDLLVEGKRLQSIGHLDEAEKMFSKCLEYCPENAEAHYKLGWVKYLQKHVNNDKRSEAFINFKKSIQNNPRYIYSDTRLILDRAINNIFPNNNSPSDSTFKKDVKQFSELLRKNGYSASNIQPRFGVLKGIRTAGPFYISNNLIHSGSKPVSADSLDVLIHLFLLGFSVSKAEIISHIGSEELNLFERLGIIEFSDIDESLVTSYVQIFPLDSNVFHSQSEHSLFFATDWPPPVSVILEEDPVMYIGPDSIALVQHAPRKNCSSVLDLCCGSGVQGITAAIHYAEKVTCVDINPRAVRFTNFNAILNGVEDKVEVYCGDLYDALPDGHRKFDYILANPPFIPVPDKIDYIQQRYNIFADGGSDGEKVIRNICSCYHEFLTAEGLLSVVTELANAEKYEEKILEWCDNSRSFKSLVIHNDPLLSVKEYSWRRAQVEWEAQVWKDHLDSQGITDMSTGLIFISNCISQSEEKKGEVRNVVICSVGKLWKPTNLDAIQKVRFLLSSEQIGRTN